jgi:hypothetical protein
MRAPALTEVGPGSCVHASGDWYELVSGPNEHGEWAAQDALTGWVILRFDIDDGWLRVSR